MLTNNDAEVTQKNVYITQNQVDIVYIESEKIICYFGVNFKVDVIYIFLENVNLYSDLISLLF